MAFTGTIAPIPVGQRGLTGSKNYTSISADYLLRAENITYEDGTIQKEGGTLLYGSSVFGGFTVTGGFDWWPTFGTQYMVVSSSSGYIYMDTSNGAGFPVTLAGGLTPTDALPVYIAGGQETAAGDRKLFIIDGVNSALCVTGTGTTANALSAPPTDWTSGNQPVTGCIHNNRLWMAVDHRVYYSTAANHEDFTDGTNAGSIQIYPGEGERIVQIMSFKGLLIVWKYPIGIYTVDTTSSSYTSWRVERVSNAIGGIGPYGAVQTDGIEGNDDIAFIDAGCNVQMLSGIQEYGSVGGKNLSQVHDLGPYFRDNVNLFRLFYCQSMAYPAKREVFWGLSSTDSETNDVRLVMDLNEPGLPRFRWSTLSSTSALWPRRNGTSVNRPMIGNTSGDIYFLDQTTRSINNGGTYTAVFQTAHTNFSYIDATLVNKRKNGKFLEFLINPTGAYTVSVEILWDGRVTQTISFSMAGTTGRPTRVKHRVTGSGTYFSFRVTDSGGGLGNTSNFSIASAFLYFTVSDEKP